MPKPCWIIKGVLVYDIKLPNLLVSIFFFFSFFLVDNLENSIRSSLLYLVPKTLMNFRYRFESYTVPDGYRPRLFQSLG